MKNKNNWTEWILDDADVVIRFGFFFPRNWICDSYKRISLSGDGRIETKIVKKHKQFRSKDL
jgi:hypothetical protein